MKRALALGVFATLAAVSLMAQGKGSPADEAAIRDLPKQYSSAWNSGDAAKAVAVFAADATFVNVRGTVSNGRADIQKGLAEDLAGEMKGSTFDATVDGIRFTAADTAVAHGSTTIKGGSLPPDGLKGHYLMVATKQGGMWKALAVHAAAMPPPGPPK